MKKFIVTITEHHAVRYLVTAKDRQEAEQLIQSGEYNSEDKLDDEIVSSDIISVEQTEPNPVKSSYPGGLCPDCHLPIPDTVVEGQGCNNCHHVFWSSNGPESGTI